MVRVMVRSWVVHSEYESLQKRQYKMACALACVCILVLWRNLAIWCCFLANYRYRAETFCMHPKWIVCISAPATRGAMLYMSIFNLCPQLRETRYYTSCNHPLREAPQGIRATWCISSLLSIHCLNRRASQSSAAQIKGRLTAWQSQFQSKALNMCKIISCLSVCFNTAVLEGGNLPNFFPVHLTQTVFANK